MAAAAAAGEEVPDTAPIAACSSEPMAEEEGTPPRPQRLDPDAAKHARWRQSGRQRNGSDSD